MATTVLTPTSSTPTAERLTYGHLTVTETGEIAYLGYPLCLSVTQTRLLTILIRAALQDCTAVVSPHLLAQGMAPSAAEAENGHATPSPAVLARVPGHVARINDKARAVGGRRLILSHPRRGYRLNPYM